MKTFTIENGTNNITFHATAQDAQAVADAQSFRNEAGLAKLAAHWPTARLVEIWNSLPGETPVKKFKDRATAVTRIWRAIQGLDEAPVPADVDVVVRKNDPDTENPAAALVSRDDAGETLAAGTVTPEGSEGVSDMPPVAPQTPDVAPAGPRSNRKPGRAKKATDGAHSAPREGSKASQVIAMLKRREGATLEEIMSAMGWQKHTTRAMLSAGGSLTKNHGLIVTSEMVGETRRYSIKS
jgi:hypothetical protein